MNLWTATFHDGFGNLLTLIIEAPSRDEAAVLAKAYVLEVDRKYTDLCVAALKPEYEGADGKRIIVVEDYDHELDSGLPVLPEASYEDEYKS